MYKIPGASLLLFVEMTLSAAICKLELLPLALRALPIVDWLAVLVVKVCAGMGIFSCWDKG